MPPPWQANGNDPAEEDPGQQDEGSTVALFGWHEGARFMILSVQGQTPREEAMDPTFMPIFSPPSWKTPTNKGSPFSYFPMALAHSVADDLKWQVPYVRARTVGWTTGK